MADVGRSVCEDPVNQLTNHLLVDQWVHLQPERKGGGGRGRGVMDGGRKGSC